MTSTSNLWIDKYYPRKISDMVLSDEFRNQLNSLVKNTQNNISNLLFVGDIGTGKTTIMNCLVREIYNNSENLSNYVFNATRLVDRKPQSFCDMIDFFCRAKIENNIMHLNKMILFDDIDRLSDKLQNIIVSLMEKFHNVLYVFTCSNMSDVINLIQSRTLILTIHKPTLMCLVPYLERICKSEKCECNSKTLEKLCINMNYDVRQIINMMQTICVGYNKITEETMLNLYSAPRPDIIKQLINECVQQKIEKAIMIINDMYSDGFTGNDILYCLFDTLNNYKLHHLEILISEEQQMNMSNIVGKTLYKINRKMDSIIQIEKCVIKICRLFGK
jgi:DNA polymerase III delta prime subunit